MEQIGLRAYGKINLGLDITGRRDDGYHLVKMVLQTVNIYDDVPARKTGGGITVKTTLPFIPNDERNLAYKAAEIILKEFDIKGGVRIDIKKNIPVGGGMAGGSADAAAIIQAMDALYGLGMSKEQMDEIALRLGTDVPFCLRKGTYFAEGIGERLTELEPMPDMSVLICSPHFPVSTKWAYESYDGMLSQEHPDINSLVCAIENADREKIFENMGNALEKVVGREYPEILQIKRDMERFGAVKALMSGSGSSVFGLFEEEAAAREASGRLNMKDNKKTFYITNFIKGE